MSDALMEDRIFRLKVKHNGRMTTISMDQLLMDYLARKLGSDEKAKQWVRDTVLNIPPSPTSRPSLSRQAQVATIVYLLDPEGYEAMMTSYSIKAPIYGKASKSSSNVVPFPQADIGTEQDPQNSDDGGPETPPPSFRVPW